MFSFSAWFSEEAIRFWIRALRARFRDQKPELDAISRHLRPDDIACDVGANKGRFIYWLSRWCRDGRVVAFEPQPDLALRLAKICASLKLDNVTVEAKAVYSHSGGQDLFIPIGHQPGASLHKPDGADFATVAVPLVSLDDYFAESDRVALLKIDVEGAELGVLKGAERILRQHKPLLVFECENRHLASGNVHDVFSWLEQLGYEGQFISGHQLLPLAQFDPAVHQRQDGEWFWKAKDYCNNFIFSQPRPS